MAICFSSYYYSKKKHSTNCQGQTQKKKKKKKRARLVQPVLYARQWVVFLYARLKSTQSPPRHQPLSHYNRKKHWITLNPEKP